MSVGVDNRIVAWSFMLFLLGIGPLTILKATTDLEASSQPVGLIQIPIVPGANFISAPLHRIHSYRGVVAGVDANSVSVAADPGWTLDQFGPRDGFSQFIVLLRRRMLPDKTEGDWWPVLTNSDSSLVLDSRSEDLADVLQPGDHIEVRRLTALKDLFGMGTSTVLIKDSNGFPSAKEEDVIRYVVGTSFGTEIIYHNGRLAAEGYYVNGEGPYDGSTVTLWPDQAIMFFRKSGSSALNLTMVGQAQMTGLTHYLQPGGNPIATGFAAPAPIGTCGLLEAGWVSDANGFVNRKEEGVVRTLVGTAFAREIFHHNGALGGAGWYVDGELNDDFPLEPGQGYMFFVNERGPVRWPQLVP